MLTLILQRLGLTALQRSAGPLQSRAGQNTRTTTSQGQATPVPEGRPQAATPKKPAKKVPVVKPTAKPSVKPTPPLKTAVKPVSKAGQPATSAKVAVKKPAEPAIKAIHKAVTKAAKNPAAQKIAAKTPVASAPEAKKPAATKSAPKTATKPATQPATKPGSSVAAAGSRKPVAAKALTTNTATTAPTPPPAPKAAPAPVTGKKNTSPATAPAPQPTPYPIERPKPMTPPAVLKPGRRSSARAPSQLPPPAPMVPTHAPDAAKASYSIMTERVMAPPPHVAAKKDPKLANNWKAKSGADLSDDEVKAMPDAEYMNDKQMAFFRHKLSVLKQEIHNSAGETTEHLREETVVVPDPADRATIEEEHALELRTRDRERKLLKKIEQSIGRIDSGDYGYCDETGEPIGVGRLIARPTANLSLEAQQRRELKQKMFGD